MSKGYRLGSGKPEKFELVNPSPAGAMSASASSMARFMIAHLQDGRFEGTQILKPETAQLMHARQRGHSPDMNAMCLGFYEESRNGHRIIGHGGDTEWFHSDLHLVLDAGLGFFVSYNSAGKGEISGRTMLWESFLDRYFPYEPPAASPVASAASDIKTVSGNYLISRRDDSAFLRLLYLFGQMKVSPAENNTIEIGDLKGFNGKPKRWEPIGPMTFRELHGQDKLVFIRDPQGRMEVVTGYPFFTFTRPPGLIDKGLLMPLGIFTLCILALAVILWPIGALVRRHYARRLDFPSDERRLRLWTRWVCLLDVILVATYATIVISGLNNIDLLSDKLNPWLHLMQVLAVVAIVGSLIALWNAARSWGSGHRGVWSKLGETLIALACVGMVFFILVGRVLHVGPIY